MPIVPHTPPPWPPEGVTIRLAPRHVLAVVRVVAYAVATVVSTIVAGALALGALTYAMGHGVEPHVLLDYGIGGHA